MSNSWKDKDPNAQDEAQKYENPVPSREFLLEFLHKWGAPIKHPHLCRELGLSDEDDIEAVRRRLIAMCRDGQLISNRKGEFGLIEKMNLIAGRVIGHRDGFGFLKPDAGGDDLFLSPRNMRELFDGDRALVQEIGVDFKGRREGKIVEVLERNTRKLVGRFDGENGFGSIIPENQRITNQVMVIPDPSTGLKYENGQLVVVELIQQPSRRQPARGRVIEVLGEHLAPGMEIKVAIHSYDIPNEWPDAVHQQIGELTPEVREEDKANRVDLRELPFVTIDGEDARDFDDAVYCEKKRFGGWRLWVAIADVSYYVRPDSALDVEAVKRGNSVYFPEYVVPMLPELLSNGLCSLNPKVDRLAMVCEMTLTRAGKLSDFNFYEAVINSKARLTYTKVGTMLTEADSEQGVAWRREYADVVPHLEQLHALYKKLRAAREERGAMDFETTETRILFSDERKIERLVPVHRNDAHKLIEECMLAANVATAQFLNKLKKPALFRIHEGPKEQKLENLRAFLGELGLNLPGGDKPEPKDYLRLSETIAGRPDRHIIETMMLRSMQQAVYSPDNQGHFGLAYDAYTHFTSPIRRYPDLLVHRIIRAAIHSDKKLKNVERPKGFKPNSSFNVGYSMEQMLALGEHCSMTERRADEATRDVVAWLKCEYMQSQIGEEFDGVISAVTGFGAFIELEDLYVEGLIHITGLPSDYYHFEAAKQRLIGERTRKVFKLGDPLRVRVVRVDLDERKIDFELASTSGGEPAKKPSKRELLAAGKIGPGTDRQDDKGRPGKARARVAGQDDPKHKTAKRKAAHKPKHPPRARRRKSS
ncbi:3'-to-5' exoribonuclease RNase R [Marinobacterium lacunae]|uniref:Ribonuclease R n=1 Tax=Marinobacterium lacunae TaxID=1232683 RepID=A0A081G1E6_9GAMM|nr:ribonuclease R [Marinobacterium lacunae]KEA64601.1 3'-to-5' exoribonuclease RNase R [Marinobacterium lacunae]